MTPKIAALRLCTRARGMIVPKPPWGLQSWSAEAESIGVLLEGDADSLAHATFIAEQIPRADTLPPGTRVVVLGASAQKVPTWRTLLGSRVTSIARAPRSEALLARGYVRLGAGLDKSTGSDVVWAEAASVDFT